MRRIRREVTRKSDGPTVAPGSRQRVRDFELSGGLGMFESPKRFRFLNAQQFGTILTLQPFNIFPFAKAEMITVKLRAFGFLAVVLVGLFFSSCAVTPRRTADVLCIGRCGRHLSLFIRQTIRLVVPTH